MLDAVLWLMENRAPQSIVDRDDSIVDKRARSTSPLLLKGTKNASMKALNDTTQPATDVVAEKMELELQMPAVRFCLIDDYDGRDLPLVELKLDNVNTSLRVDSKIGGSTKLGGTCQGSASTDFYNGNLSAWEPVP